MTLEDIYDSTNHFLRDALGYWLPGCYLLGAAFFRTSAAGVLTLEGFGKLFSDINIYAGIAFLAFALIVGYLVGSATQAILENFFRMVLERNKDLSNLSSFVQDVGGGILVDSPLKDRFNKEVVEKNNEGRSIRATVLNYASNRIAPKKDRNLIERYNALRLFHGNMATMLVISFFLFSSWSCGWQILFAVSVPISIYLSFDYTRRREWLALSLIAANALIAK